MTASRRSFWVKQITLWHWVSSGVCLGGMLLFTITGVTLNHAAELTATPRVTQVERAMPAAVRAELAGLKAEGRHAVPAGLGAWLAKEFGTTPPQDPGEWSDGEVFISLPRPGGDGWVAINRKTGMAKYEKTDRGWIPYLNDLHKGRHTGRVWVVFIDVVAGACLIFTLTGLLILQIHAGKRPSTWPLVGLGMVLPVLLMLLFVHR